MTQLNNAPVELENDQENWEQYKDDKVATKPKITIFEANICLSCEG